VKYRRFDSRGRFVSKAARRHGRPAHFVSDHARCFTSQVLADSEGHARPAPAAAIGSRRPRRDGRTRPRPLRPLPSASGSWRGDTGRGPLRMDASASLGDPASSRQTGRRPDGFTVSRRVPRCRAAAAATGSKSSLKEGHPGENVGRRVRARKHRSGRGAGPCAPAPAAIPIASQQICTFPRFPPARLLLEFQPGVSKPSQAGVGGKVTTSRNSPSGPEAQRL
jgi:hypothetical protein